MLLDLVVAPEVVVVVIVVVFINFSIFVVFFCNVCLIKAIKLPRWLSRQIDDGQQKTCCKMITAVNNTIHTFLILIEVLNFKGF